ncbi:MAG: prealbumin-like fold domain-containing protein [Coriobacteriales bacterium]|nr:prealbumin-like fold domain-containing protein [Coriobacteriales bacterium]
MHKHARQLSQLIAFVATALLLALATLQTAYAAGELSISTGDGSVQIRYSKVDASYDVYRIFDLALNSNGEAYGYVIRETQPDGSRNPWWEFLTTHGVGGDKSATPYAVLSGEKDESKRDAAYFEISTSTIKIGDAADYHLVTITDQFAKAQGQQPGGMGGMDEGYSLVSDESQLVRDFAQAALGWARGLQLEQGHYVARGHVAIGSEVGDGYAGTGVHQYSGDNAYVDDAPLGTYVLGTAIGTVCFLNTGSPAAYVYDKNELPELFKQVRVNGTAATCEPYAELSADEQSDLVWSEEFLQNWAYRTSANLGSYAQFKTVIIVTQGISDYRLHEVMEGGLSFVDQASSSVPTGMYDDARLVKDGAYNYEPRVYLYSRAAGTAYDIPRTLDGVTNWELSTPQGDGCALEVVFKGAGTYSLSFGYLDGGAHKTVEVKDWDRIVFTYWVKVGSDVVVYGSDKNIEQVATAKDLSSVRDGSASVGEPIPVQTHTQTDGNNRNTCSAVLTYGESSHTTWARAEVASYQFDVAASVEDQGKALTAEYELYPALGNGPDSSGKGASSYTVTVNSAERTYHYLPESPLRFVKSGTTYSFVDGAEGDAAAGETALVARPGETLRVRGLEAGTYLLVQTKAPEGYALQEDPVVVTVHADAYSNTDLVENDTPRTRHSNAEGDLSVTVRQADGKTETSVCAWQAGKDNGGVVLQQAAKTNEQPGAFFAVALVGVIGIITTGVVLVRRRARNNA